MTADMYLKVDTTKEEKMEISGAIGTLKNLLETFQRTGYIHSVDLLDLLPVIDQIGI